MKLESILFVAFLSSLAGHARAAVVAGPFTNDVTGHYYYLLNPNTWTTLETQAVGLGGHLATVDSMEEQQWLVTRFSSYLGIGSAFIGLTDRDQEGTWVWVSGETNSYRNWYPGEPNGGSAENFVELSSASNLYTGRWNDQNGSSSRHGIVELVGPPRPRVTITVAQVDVCWPSKTNQFYQVEYRPIQTTNWFPLGLPVAGQHGTNCITDTVRGVPDRLYRVRDLP